MECFGTTDFDNNSRLITLSAIIISGLHCTCLYSLREQKTNHSTNAVTKKYVKIHVFRTIVTNKFEFTKKLKSD